MNTTLAKVMIALTLACGLSEAARAQLPDLPAPADANAQNVRPSDTPQKAVIVRPAGPIRGSLFKQVAKAPAEVGPNGEALSGPPVSLIAVVPTKPRKYQKKDIVTVIVALNSSSTSTSAADSEKKQAYDLALQQMAQLTLASSGIPYATNMQNPSNLPEVKFNYDNKRNNTADQSRQDTVSDRFAAEVVDVKPNGTLVLEAVNHVEMDSEVLHYQMTGTCRIEDITGQNTILSSQLANLNFSKKTTGEVRDGVKRGWLNGLIDKFNPF